MGRNAFQEISEEHVDEMLRLDPVAATMNGVHGFDAEYPDPSLGAVRRRSDWFKEQGRRLDADVVESELGPYERVDYLFLRSLIRTGLLLNEEQREPERNPILYPDTSMYGIFLLYSREFAPLDQRLDPLLKRLERSASYLENSKETIHNVPKIFAEIAIEVSESGSGFIDEVEGGLLADLPAEKDRIQSACKTARDGFTNYAEWIREKILPNAVSEFAIGKRLFDARMKDEHLLPYDSGSLEKLGWGLLRQTQELMQELAEQISPGKSWKEVIEEAKNDTPTIEGVLDAYREEMERARRYIVDKRLTPMPEGEELEIIETPQFERSLIPYAAYLMPGPFDAIQKGQFYVTPVDTKGSPEDQQAQLQGHNFHTIPVVTLHEAYPGHHLQLCWANRTKTRLRKLANSTVLCEGWALYCEEMMYEEGYYKNDLARMFQLKDTSLRAARVVIDVRLQTGAMSYEEAVEFLIAEAMLERPNAEAEAKRYTTTPTQPMSYALGKQAILDLRSEVKGKLGDGFSLHDFHAAVLESGSLPVGLVRESTLQRLQLGVT